MFELPLLDSPIGPGLPWPASLGSRQEFSLPTDLQNSPADLVLVRLTFDPRMAGSLTGNDLAALDTSWRFRTNLAPDGLYVILNKGEAVLRQVRYGARCLYLVAADNVNRPLDWEALPLTAASIADAVKAKVVWIGREQDSHPARH